MSSRFKLTDFIILECSSSSDKVADHSGYPNSRGVVYFSLGFPLLILKIKEKSSNFGMHLVGSHARYSNVAFTAYSPGLISSDNFKS